MRTTSEIIIAVQDNEPVSDEELRLALLVSVFWEQTLNRNLRKLADEVVEGKPSAKMTASFVQGTLEGRFAAYKKPPADFLEPHNIPGHPEYERRRRIALGILDKVIKQEKY